MAFVPASEDFISFDFEHTSHATAATTSSPSVPELVSPGHASSSGAVSPARGGNLSQLSSSSTGDISSSSLDSGAGSGSHKEFHPATFAAAKAKWLQKQLQEREAEYVERQDCVVFVGTWNVNGKPPQESLDPWLLPSNPSERMADLYAVGFQELDLSANALLLNDTSRSTLWEEAIYRSLNSRGQRYSLISSRQLVGMLLCVFVREELRPHVGNAASVAEGVGIMGMMGNKGGVGVRIRFFDSTLCFVNSHLSAHQENIERRNQDWRDITRRLQFPPIPINYAGLDQRLLSPKPIEDGFPTTTASLSSSASSTTSSVSSSAPSSSPSARGGPSTSDESSGILDHEHCFWLGDLNYRIDLPDWQCRQFVAAQNWAALRARDQLIDQMSKKATFEGWTEGLPSFAPTYKYDLGCNNYDSSEKRRVPAWCDRILWRTKSDVRHINQVAFRRHELLTSDHRPVSSVFVVSLKKIIVAHRAKMFGELVKQLDMLENELTPDVQLSGNLVQFGPVSYMVANTQHIQLENTGQVIARFRFIPKLTERAPCKRWMWVNPAFGMLVPGEKMNVGFTMYVDNATAEALNLCREELEDTLIMHIENSKDCFVAVSGQYQTCAFGCPITYLVRFIGPVRTSKPLPEEATEEHLSIPKELWYITDAIYSRGLGHKNLFLETGVQQEMEQIRDALSTGSSLDDPNWSVYSLGESFVRLLESFPISVVPQSLYRQCLETAHSFTLAKQLLSFLPPAHYNVFHYVVAFLREVLTQSPKNQLTQAQLAMLFGSVLIRPPPGEVASEEAAAAKRKAQFLSNFLEPEK